VEGMSGSQIETEIYDDFLVPAITLLWDKYGCYLAD
jgi:hypothetical protein